MKKAILPGIVQDRIGSIKAAYRARLVRNIDYGVLPAKSEASESGIGL